MTSGRRLRGPFAVAIWDPRSRTLTLARDHLGFNVVMWHKSEQFFAFATMPKGLFALPDVPRDFSEEKFADFLVLNHADHATTIYRHMFRVPPAHLVDVGWPTDRCSSAATGRRPTSSRSGSLRPGLCGRVARLSRSRRAPPDAQRSPDRLPPQRRAQFLVGGGARGPRARRKRIGGSLPSRRCRARASTARCRPAATPTRRPMWRRSAKLAGNIDVTYVRNDECDDFADLERFFLALEGAGAQSDQSRLDAGDLAARARAGPPRPAGRSLGNYTISWPAGRRRSTICARAAPHGLSPVAAVLSPLVLCRAGWRFASSSSSRSCRRSWRSGPTGAATRTGSRPGRITRRSDPISPSRWG